MIVLIDNGHGQNTPGKRSPDGVLREYSYTREIADDVVRELIKEGVQAERIVRESSDVPLSERARRVNEACGRYGAKNVLLVSIHCNAAGNGSGWMKATGWSAYTSKGKTKSDALAECLYDAAGKYLAGQRIRRDMSDGDSDWEENFYILSKTKCAAVLTENFFQDNKDDVAYLLCTEGRRNIVNTHVEGILNFIKTHE